MWDPARELAAGSLNVQSSYVEVLVMLRIVAVLGVAIFIAVVCYKAYNTNAYAVMVAAAASKYIATGVDDVVVAMNGAVIVVTAGASNANGKHIYGSGATKAICVMHENADYIRRSLLCLCWVRWL